MASRITLGRVWLFVLPISIFFGTFFTLFSLERSQPFVYDEAVYLTKARAWQINSPADEFKIYRPIGMPVIGRALLEFGNSETYLRFFGVFFGACTILLLYLIFTRIFGWLVGLSVSLVTASSSLFLHNAPQFLNDVPSSGLLFGSLIAIWIWHDSKGSSNWIYLFGPFSAAAFYLRYGASSTLTLIAAVSIFIFWNSARRELKDLEKTVFSGIFSVLLFAPHFIESVLVTHDVLGILKRSGGAAGREYLGEGLLTYIRWLPHDLGGWLFGPLAIFGILATFYLLFRKNWTEQHRGLVWVGLIGASNLILTGVLVHAESQYVFFPVTLLCGAGIASIFLTLSKFSWSKLLLAGLFLAASIISGYKNYHDTNEILGNNGSSVRNFYVDAASAIRNDAGVGKGCAIWSASSSPELSWYSGCHTLPIDTKDVFVKDFLTNFRRPCYSVVFSKLGEKQLDENVAKEFGIELSEIFRAKTSQSLGDVVVYKLTDQGKIRLQAVTEKE